MKTIKNKEYSAGFIVYRLGENDEKEFLILHYPGGHFDFPKGHLEGDETNYQAAVRELAEETGITDIEPDDSFSYAIKYSFRRGNEIIEKEVTFFLAKTNQSEIKISHEHQNFLWLPYQKALAKVTFDNAKQVLILAHQHLHKIIN